MKIFCCINIYKGGAHLYLHIYTFLLCNINTLSIYNTLEQHAAAGAALSNIAKCIYRAQCALRYRAMLLLLLQNAIKIRPCSLIYSQHVWHSLFFFSFVYTIYYIYIFYYLVYCRSLSCYSCCCRAAIKNIGNKKTCAVLGAIYQQAASGFNSKDIVFHSISIYCWRWPWCLFLYIFRKKKITSATGEF